MSTTSALQNSRSRGADLPRPATILAITVVMAVATALLLLAIGVPAPFGIAALAVYAPFAVTALQWVRTASTSSTDAPGPALAQLGYTSAQPSRVRPISHF